MKNGAQRERGTRQTGRHGVRSCISKNTPGLVALSIGILNYFNHQKWAMQSLQNNIKTKYMNFYIHNGLNLQKTLTIFSEIYPKKAKDIPLNSVILGVAWGCGTSTHQGCQFWSRNCSTTPPGGCLLWPLHPVKRSWLPAWLMQHRLLLPIGKWASKRNINFSDYFSSK